jgi:hypothetical protein
MKRPAAPLVRLLLLGPLSTMAVLAACSSSAPSNGEASKSANTIFADAERATESAASVHIAGRFNSGSDKIALDLVDSSKRSGGTIADDGQTFQVILAGKTAYIKGSKATMTKISGTAAGQLLGGRWLKTTPGNQDFGSLTGLFKLSNLIGSIQPEGSLRKGSPTTVKGQSAIGLTDPAHKATLYVATSGRPYMIELVGGPGQPGTLTFDQFGSATPPAIPKGAVDLDQLEGGSSS